MKIVDPKTLQKYDVKSKKEQKTFKTIFTILFTNNRWNEKMDGFFKYT